jgi:hypothetical protein
LETRPNLTVHYGHYLQSTASMPLATPGPTGRRFAAQTPPKACLEISRKARYAMYNAEEARNAYRFWLNSAPFDCGMTVSSGLREGCCQTEVNRVQVYSVTKKLPCPTVLHRQHQSPRKPLIFHARHAWAAGRLQSPVQALPRVKLVGASTAAFFINSA